jgi:hypothetical protein
MRTLSRTLGLAALILAISPSACAPYGALCEDEMICRDGNDADYDACVISYEANEDLSGLYGCEAKWDNYLICIETNARCDGNDNWTDDGDCGDEWVDYRDCVD